MMDKAETRHGPSVTTVTRAVLRQRAEDAFHNQTPTTNDRWWAEQILELLDELEGQEHPSFITGRLDAQTAIWEGMEKKLDEIEYRVKDNKKRLLGLAGISDEDGHDMNAIEERLDKIEKRLDHHWETIQRHNGA